MSTAQGRDCASCVLDDSERELALAEVRALARMAQVDRLPVPFGSFADLAARCAIAVTQVRSRPGPPAGESMPRFALPGCAEVAFDGSPVLVIGRTGDDDVHTAGFVAEVSGPLGGEPGRRDSIPVVESHVRECRAAAALLTGWDPGRGVVRGNSGVIVPFPCTAPESGSGTSRTMPGVLMLPTGVPAPIYAECWLHECLHTELILAEWMTGGDLVRSPRPLPTPWRTVDRPANLLLHGSFVFATVARFMRDRAADYERISPDWLLSAARGRTVRACDVIAASDFRLAQVREAMQTLRGHASFTSFGRRVEDAVMSSLAEMGG